ncbi:hypothetical protein BKA70DRAFT_1294039 [Coprinopsis sp. MPI-PUGE-AT-0042]|nr:hypothetical protein BKA70DRAFT_1294039 [Coprinopsis sp. MPI-PUGE-AT-0042]
MPTSDLPTELWLLILSYLPSSTFLKLIGVNRTFFELALNYKYEEVRFLSNDAQTLHIFKQLRHENISRRVHHLYLRPDFLLDLNDHEPSRKESLVDRRLTWMRKRFRPKASPEDLQSRRIPLAAGQLLQVAATSIVQCRRLQKITVIIPDHPVSSAFSPFLAALRHTLGHELQELCIKATLAKIPALLVPIANIRAQLPNLSSFDLTIPHSRDGAPASEAEETTSTLIHFLRSFKSSLSSFSLAPLVVYNMSPLFDGLEEMPNLKRFELVFVMCDLTFSKSLSLVDFLSRQSATLEHLVFDQRLPHKTFFPSRSSLGSFLTSEFTRVKMAKLHTFRVGSDSPSETLPPRLVPDILPCLQHLTIKRPSISPSTLPLILESTGGTLESLDISLWEFSTKDLDLLALRCPRLRRLTVGYSSCPSINIHYPTPSLFIVRPRPRGLWYEAYSSRRYPQWPLEYVRMGGTWLGRLDECGEIHPDVEMMDAVAQTVLPRVVEKDLERRCFHVT